MRSHKHRKITIRNWVQVILPSAALASLALLGGSSISHYASERHQVAATRISPPAAVIPSGEFRKPPVAAVAPITASPAYTVHPGDNLWKLAARFCGKGTSENRLAAANHLQLEGILPLGKMITIRC